MCADDETGEPAFVNMHNKLFNDVSLKILFLEPWKIQDANAYQVVKDTEYGYCLNEDCCTSPKRPAFCLKAGVKFTGKIDGGWFVFESIGEGDNAIQVGSKAAWEGWKTNTNNAEAYDAMEKSSEEAGYFKSG